MGGAVLKYKLAPGQNNIVMPKGAEPLSVGRQLDDGGVDTCYLWCFANPQEEREVRGFLVVGTGETVPAMGKCRFIGSVHHVDGWMVFHVFELKLY